MKKQTIMKRILFISLFLPALGFGQAPDSSTTEQLLTEIRDLLKETRTEKKKEFVPRTFGFAVYYRTNYLSGGFWVNAYEYQSASRFMNGASINLSFSTGMQKKVGFRFEPFVDYLFAKGDPPTNTFYSSSGFNTGVFESGLRFLPVVRRGRVNIYFGVSGSFLYVTRKAPIYNPNSNIPTGYKNAFRLGGSAGLVLGGEYLVTPHIGIRIESGVMYFGVGDEYFNDSGNISDSANSQIGSFARFGGSFYF